MWTVPLIHGHTDFRFPPPCPGSSAHKSQVTKPHQPTNQPTNSMEHSSSSANQEIPRILWNPSGSVRHLPASATCPYSGQINPVHALPSNFFKINFNIILPSTPRFSKWSHFLGSLPPEPCMQLSCPYTCHMPRPSYPSLFHHLNSIW